MSIFNSGGSGSGSGGDILSKVIESRNETVSCFAYDDIPADSLVSVSDSNSEYNSANYINPVSDSSIEVIQVGSKYVILAPKYSGYTNYDSRYGLTCITPDEYGTISERFSTDVKNLVSSSYPLPTSLGNNIEIEEIDDNRFLLAYESSYTSNSSTYYRYIACIITVGDSGFSRTSQTVLYDNSSSSRYGLQTAKLDSSLVAVAVACYIYFCPISDNSISSYLLYGYSMAYNVHRMSFVNSGAFVFTYVSSNMGYAKILKLTYNSSTGKYSSTNKDLSMTNFSSACSSYNGGSSNVNFVRVGDNLVISYIYYDADTSKITPYIYKITSYDSTPTSKNCTISWGNWRASGSEGLSMMHYIGNGKVMLTYGSVGIYKYLIFSPLPSSLSSSSFKNFILSGFCYTVSNISSLTRCEIAVPFDSSSFLYFYSIGTDSSSNTYRVRKVGYSGTSVTGFIENPNKPFQGYRAINQLNSGERIGYIDSSVSAGNLVNVPIINRLP